MFININIDIDDIPEWIRDQAKAYAKESGDTYLDALTRTVLEVVKESEEE